MEVWSGRKGGVRCAESLAGAEQPGNCGGAVHGRAADARAGDPRCQPGTEAAAGDAARRSGGPAADLLERCFDAAAPNRRWVAGITYVQTFSGWVYTAFVMDLFARRVLGWQVADHLRSILPSMRSDVDMGAAGRGSRRPGPPFRPGPSTRLSVMPSGSAEERAVRSVGSKGDSYDNAAAEALNSLYKRELIDPKKDWQGVDDVMLATMDWVQWYNEGPDPLI